MHVYRFLQLGWRYVNHRGVGTKSLFKYLFNTYHIPPVVQYNRNCHQFRLWPIEHVFSWCHRRKKRMDTWKSSILTSKPRKITSREKKWQRFIWDQGKNPQLHHFLRLGALQLWCCIHSISLPWHNDGQTSCRNSGRRKIIHYSQNWRGMFSGYSWTKPSSFWRGRQFSGDRITLGYLVREDQQGQTKGTLLLRLSAVRKKVAATLCKLQSTRSKCCMAKPLVLKLANSYE